MWVESLKITNMRAIGFAEATFLPGFNLLVGVNGVGKTTALNALALCLSGITKQVNGLRQPALSCSLGDIKLGSGGLQLECSVTLNADASHTYLIYEPGPGVASERKSVFLEPLPKRAGKAEPLGRPLAILYPTRRAVTELDSAKKGRATGDFSAAFVDALEDRPLALGTFARWMAAQMELGKERPQSAKVVQTLELAVRRFLPGYRNLRPIALQGPSSKPDLLDAALSVVSGPLLFAAVALGAALLSNPGGGTPTLYLDQGERITVGVGDLTDAEQSKLRQALKRADDWLALNWRDAGEHVTDAERSQERAEARVQRLQVELAKELPRCRNLRPNSAGEPDSLVDLLPLTLDVRQLSDGERGTLALVLDLTRRLAQANPHLSDPAAEAEAVVLIDEIDLHLHPRWQREVIQNLTAAFPRCQFIATTHSPQVISEVERDRIQIITPEGIYRPSHSFGIDSSRVLEEIMDVRARPAWVDDLLSSVSTLAGEGRLIEAKQALALLTQRLELGENDPEVVRLQTLIDFAEGEP
jgi:hypothetical protein